MKNCKVKSLVYSLCFALLLTLICLTLSRHENDFMSILIVFTLAFVASMIMLWDNKPLIHYFWKGHDDWMTFVDRLICGTSVIIVYLSARYVWFYYQEDGKINILALILCISAAFSYRRIYLNHAPDDVEQYETDQKQDTYVTIAECKDVESAHIIKNLLESNGIEAITYGESAPQFLGKVPVRVLVRRRDKEAAERLVNE